MLRQSQAFVIPLDTESWGAIWDPYAFVWVMKSKNNIYYPVVDVALDAGSIEPIIF